MPSQTRRSSRLRNSAVNPSIEEQEQEEQAQARNIGLGELETRRRELEVQLRPLRLQITDLRIQHDVAHSRMQEDADRYEQARFAANYRGPDSATERSLRQTAEAAELRREGDNVKRHYTNNTTNSEASRSSVARVQQLQVILDEKRIEAYTALVEQRDIAYRDYTASYNTFLSFWRQMGALVLQRTILEEAIRDIENEEEVLINGRGKKRQHRATYKRGKKGKNTRKKRL